MDFAIRDIDKDIVKLAADFAAKRLAPTVQERDEKEIFDRSIVNEMGELGLLGIPYEEDYDGVGADFLSMAMACEEISKTDPSIGLSFEVHTMLCSWPIWKFGTEEQKQKFLKPLASGVKLGAFGLTEPNAGTDALNGSTTAVKDGDHYVLNGSKIFNTNGGEAEITVVFASTDKSKGAKGMSAFIVEKGTPGFTYGKKEVKMGIRASVQRELVFQDVKVPAANLLGKEGEGFKIAMMTLDGGRVGVGAQALGIAEGAYEHALKYAKERVQFGKPIAKFQAVSFILADMKAKIEAARYLVYKAAYSMNQGVSYSLDAAIAKKIASDVAMQVTTDAVQVFGGYGFTREYPVERYMRDAKITQIYEGTSQVQQMVISGAILR
ncbi:acyl-CoA dehydrogenase [Megasphaera cerevisiae DSM 20462]|jgi:alkylation response protein AidB-like acyl-CoA dehydrogenase|uniref:Acyl-CoA dehydrogenase n=1 Tax=Megasphaera cerevisiae DSM 20462 TaxID=1122219 RepID=A0A0J6ZRQ1_9FIRM|nr:acyl-CoA dehydrogenase [Megasphaera cerevisiae]KMO87626.1 acyl-CoA dehydrogenase [Megasphaera cerevisiae DSM 20462]OKY54663.1 acyl-CoA dehydrogenase [Megasphaera cerevisiae]SJZ66957.1 Acyl-CoA dehydrogenase [Megasphaera cerevisiae DSM 20462]